MTCEAIKFGVNNHVESATVTATPEPVTDLEWIKNEYPARLVRWGDRSADIVVDIVFDEPMPVSYFAIPGSNLNADDSVKLELFETLESPTDLLMMDAMPAGGMIPLGLFRWGIDPWGGKDTSSSAWHTIVHWIDRVIVSKRARLTISPFYEAPEVIEYDDTIRQDDNGVVSVEAESCGVTAAGDDKWEIQIVAGASGGEARWKTAHAVYQVGAVGPTMFFDFVASQSGAHNVWIRIKSTDGDSIYSIFDGDSQISSFNSAYQQSGVWVWINTRVVTLVAEQTHNITLMARDKYLYIDKIVVLPVASANPSGEGPAESSGGVVGVSGEKVEIRSLMIGETLQLEHAVSYGGVSQYLAGSDIIQTTGGSNLLGSEPSASRAFQLELEKASDTDEMRLIAMEKHLMGRSFIVSAYPHAPEWNKDSHTLLARFAGPLRYTHIKNKKHQIALPLLEV